MDLESLTAADSATWISAWDATVENAKEILSWQTIPQEVKTFAETKPERWTTVEMVERVIEKMLTQDGGELAFESKDGSVTRPVTAEAKAETDAA